MSLHAPFVTSGWAGSAWGSVIEGECPPIGENPTKASSPGLSRGSTWMAGTRPAMTNEGSDGNLTDLDLMPQVWAFAFPSLPGEVHVSPRRRSRIRLPAALAEARGARSRRTARL